MRLIPLEHLQPPYQKLPVDFDTPCMDIIKMLEACFSAQSG